MPEVFNPIQDTQEDEQESDDDSHQIWTTA